MIFPSDLLDELRARTPMGALVSKKVQLIPAGRQRKGCCPFHPEKTPSFYVYDDGYHCFGCGAHGDAISFVMESEGLSFEAAVRRLAKQAGIRLPEQRLSHQESKRSESTREDILPVRKRPDIDNQSDLAEQKLDAIFGMAAQLLVRRQHDMAASILANGGGRIFLWGEDSDLGQVFRTWRFLLRIPAKVYFDIEDRQTLQTLINEAVRTAMEPLNDLIEIEITTELEEDPNWRDKVNRQFLGEGVNNQGRVRSDNIASRAYDGLLFRSRPEALFYNALRMSFKTLVRRGLADS